MKHLLICIFAVLALAACKKTDTSVPASSSNANLPKECVDYTEKVTACVSKLGAAGDAVKQSFETAKAQWNTVSDKEALSKACKQASDAFQQTASALKC